MFVKMLFFLGNLSKGKIRRFLGHLP